MTSNAKILNYYANRKLHIATDSKNRFFLADANNNNVYDVLHGSLYSAKVALESHNKRNGFIN